MKKYFLLRVSSGRVGSHFLGSLLRQNKNIIYEDELLSNFKRSNETKIRYDVSLKNVKEGFQFLSSEVYTRELKKKVASNSAIGFKFGGPNLSTNFNQNLKWIINSKIDLIYLRRENIVETLISQLELSMKINPEKFSHIAKKTDQNKVYITNFPEFLNRYNRLKKLHFEKLKKIKSSKINFFSTTYEDLCKDTQKVITNMCNFLGVPAHKVNKDKTTKKSSSSYLQLHERIINSDELIVFLYKNGVLKF